MPSGMRRRRASNLRSITAGGSFGYWRGLAAGTLPFGSGSLTGAGEVVFYNGPWQIPDSMRKFNGFLRYSEGTPDNGLSITALGYTNSWHATDQIPARAVADGSLGLYGSVDPTDGGDTQRYSLSMNWRQRSLFASLAKRDPPRRRVHELGVIAGLRGV